ncbi:MULTISPECIES: hypothetical protein [Pseudomonas]|uniref:Uncharacterized protein n=1 Tax=Pseudomonas carnis TaxID=2487355 RepID=A0ABT5RRC7_9PSED|nr:MULTISPECIES: hypothetical protein [Pseudomonas]MDD1947773.1 hypothetical protein [Pseudomonas carnis]
MNFERKVVITLAAHETCLQQIKRLTRIIGVCIGKCQNGYDQIGPRPASAHDDIIGILPWPNGEHHEILHDEQHRRKTHIWEAFQHREPSSCGYGMVWLQIDEIADFLADQECVHCTRAWHFILERKRVKKDLGHLRLSIRGLGKSALKKLIP